MRILIVKLGSIGDIIHALPALAAIRASLPDAEIGWVAESRSAEILRGNKLIDHLIEVDTRSLRGIQSVERFLAAFRGQAAELRRPDWDVSLDLQGLLKSAIIGKLSGAKRRFGFGGRAAREPASRVFNTTAVRVPARTHVVRKNLALASRALKIEVPGENFAFPIFTDETDRQEASSIVAISGPDFAILNPAGGWPTKLWPAENYGRLADMLERDLGLSSVVVTGPDELELARKVESASRAKKLLLRQPSLKGFFELAKLSRVYVGGDTGPTHIALAAGTPVVGIFGPTEWWRNGSTNRDDICVERNDIGCRVDCHRRSCSNWICMDIDVETVFSAVRSRLEKAGEASKISHTPSKQT